MNTEIQHEKCYSVIVQCQHLDPLFPQWLQTLNDVFTEKGKPFEIILVSNGTGKFLRSELNRLGDYNNGVKVLELNQKSSQAIRLKAAFEESSGEIIVVCNNRQQITTDSLVELLDSMDNQVDIVSSWRDQRHDSSFNQFQSRIFNAIVSKITRSEFRDLSSAIKVFRRKVFEEIELYGNMYRFLPILAARKGFKTKEVKCRHYQWCETIGHCNISEYMERIIDIFTLAFVTNFAKKPIRFFSLIGLSFGFMGLMINCYIAIEKIFLGITIGLRPLLLIGMFLMVLGIQVASMGLLGEMIAFTLGRHRKEYTIDKEI